MYRKVRTKTGRGLLVCVNENLPGKIINSYKFKENSETFYMNLAYQIKSGHY